MRKLIIIIIISIVAISCGNNQLSPDVQNTAIIGEWKTVFNTMGNKYNYFKFETNGDMYEHTPNYSTWQKTDTYAIDDSIITFTTTNGYVYKYKYKFTNNNNTLTYRHTYYLQQYPNGGEPKEVLERQ